MILALFTGIVLAQADGGHDIAVNDAGVPVAIYSTCPVAPPVIVLDGGWVLMPPERASRVGCMLAGCEFDRAAKAKQLDEVTAPVSWYAVIGAAVSAGIIGYGAAKVTTPGSK